jgi:superfamily II DNA/RNA helicase
LDRFRDDPACRVFLSTDAGGTGLNLQAASTVINLEVPWNPAVLEQRISRVHRLGQHRPVRAINLVTRGSIEERVLQTLEQKRSLFQEVFAGTSDEIRFEAMGQQAFVQTVRELVSEESRPLPVVEPAPDPRQALVQAGIQFLEALASYLASGNGQQAAWVGQDSRTGQAVLQLPLPAPEILQRGAAAMQAVLEKVGAGRTQH